MSDAFVGEIRMVGWNFAARGWAFCDGQLLPIQQNTALFSLLGTTYGGDGRTTFGLPDLRGRMAMGHGGGPGLSPRVLGDAVGQPSHTLTTAEMPAHSHPLNAAAAGTTGTPGPAVALASGVRAYRSPPSNPVSMSAGLTPTGGGQAHENRQPYLGVNFVIATQGIFPPRG
jgi:microcystin-dependent protein